MPNDPFSTYLSDINKAYSRGDATEHTHRPALKTLIETLGKKITATNEPKRIECGAPDYVISRKVKNIDQTIGYIEAKDIGENLTKILKTEQIKKKYLPSLHNFILTDYIEFRWFVGAEHRMTVRLADESGGKFKLLMTGANELNGLFNQFFAQELVKIKSAKDLAAKMAGMAKLLRDIIQKTFEHESEKGSLHGQYEAFKKVLLHDLDEIQFADIYAQTICYGLFAARCYINDTTIWGKDKHAAFHGVDGKEKKFTRENAAYLLPKTNPFLRNVFSDIVGVRLDDRIAWLVDDLIVLLRETNMGDVLRGFGRKTKRKDPVIHFYETFLAEYDAKLKKSRGVYYTPDEVVSYIVRSVDWILKNKFNLKKGLADNSKIKIKVEETEKEFHRCLILDPAAGTGTFLYEVIKQIQKNMSRQKGAWPGYVKKHLLPRIFGFELMMAPYTVCHMKLGLELADSGYDFEGEERLGIYLTNTLEEAEEMSGMPLFTQWLAEEARAANEVKKDMPIMVVLGNPPYAVNSVNKGKWISNLVRNSYYPNDEIKESNPKLLLDDYVKFIRYAQHRIEQTGNGILAFITNHGYLDNPTFRRMRKQLLDTFSDIYIINLHGNSNQKEICPDGSPDKNVFDIRQGVSIGIFVKEYKNDIKCKIHHMDLWGLREKKYHYLLENDIKTSTWKTITPDSPFYFFVPQNIKLRTEFQRGLRINEIMSLYSMGIKTNRDHFLIDNEHNKLVDRISRFSSEDLSSSDILLLFGLEDGPYWNNTREREKINKTNWEDNIKQCLYRPFDIRYLLYQQNLIEIGRGGAATKVMCHITEHENLGLITVRQVAEGVFNHVLVTRNIVESRITISNKGAGYLFPLYLYPGDNNTKGQMTFNTNASDWTAGKDGRIPNLDKCFVDEFVGKIGLKFISDGKGDLKKTFGPEDIFSYIYAVFHSPEYRKRYAEFLKIDFPRVPMTSDKKMFVKLCKAGEELVGLHLMESKKFEDDSKYPEFNVEGQAEVEKGYPKYVVQSGKEQESRIYINKGQYFEGVRPEVWEFHIGGYQVCEKWLKDRRGRKLSFDDIEHYQKITVALGETIKLMAKIEEIIDAHGGWPIK